MDLASNVASVGVLAGSEDRGSCTDPRVLAMLDALRAVVDPEVGENVVDLGMIRSCRIDNDHATVEIALTVAACPMRHQLEQETRRAAERVNGVNSVTVSVVAMEQDERAAFMSRARRLAQEHPPISDIPTNARILGIMSGKGGVGKSSLSANLAVAIAARGLTVGLLDADIWGFSIPRMLGVAGELAVRDKKIVPAELEVGAGRLKIVSMGFLSDEDEAIMWRGLVLNRALQHFIEDVRWGGLDYLLVDLPPGTGDVQMGLARMLPRTELILVTTPGLGAQKVAGRAADMARKGNLRVAGVIENMSGFTCEHGEFYALFGEGGGQRLADSVGVPLLAQVPLDPSVARGGDAGLPAALNSASALQPVFAKLAETIVTDVAPLVPLESCSARMLERLDAALESASS